jgi:arylsulfatase A-like enzyme
MLLLLLGCVSEPEAPSKPDVLLVIMDTVRADRLHTYGNPVRNTAQLDALAASGVLFEEAISVSNWTLPSHGSMFTGLPPIEHGARRYEKSLTINVDGGQTGWAVGGLDPEVPTLAERFKANGYRTILFSSNSWLNESFGLQRGFDLALVGNDEGVLKNSLQAIQVEKDKPLLLVLNLMMAHDPYVVHPHIPFSQQHADVVAGAEWTETLRDEDPLALTYNRVSENERSPYMDSLVGELPLSETHTQVLKDLYDGELANLDKMLSALVNGWLAAQRAGIIVVTADHGESLGEDGIIGHGSRLSSAQVHVPLVIVAPGRLPAGERVSSPVSLIQLHDTLLDLADLGDAPNSLVPLIDNPNHPMPPVVATSFPELKLIQEFGDRYHHDLVLWRDGDQQIIFNNKGELRSTQSTVLEPPPEGFLRTLQQALPDERQQRPPERQEVPDGMVEKLRALGYMDAGLD